MWSFISIFLWKTCITVFLTKEKSNCLLQIEFLYSNVQMWIKSKNICWKSSQVDNVKYNFFSVFLSFLLFFPSFLLFFPIHSCFLLFVLLCFVLFFFVFFCIILLFSVSHYFLLASVTTSLKNMRYRIGKWTHFCKELSTKFRHLVV